MFVTVKFRERNSDGGTSGFGRLRMSGTSASVATAPAASEIQAMGSAHARSWPRVRPKVSPPDRHRHRRRAKPVEGARRIGVPALRDRAQADDEAGDDRAARS